MTDTTTITKTDTFYRARCTTENVVITNITKGGKQYVTTRHHYEDRGFGAPADWTEVEVIPYRAIDRLFDRIMGRGPFAAV